jgi:hypothetical protein
MFSSWVKVTAMATLAFGSTEVFAQSIPQTIAAHPDLGMLSVIGMGILFGGVVSALRTRRNQP